MSSSAPADEPLTIEQFREMWPTVVRSQGRRLIWLAAETGYAYTTVRQYHIGDRRPSDRWLQLAASALGVTVA